VKELLATKKSLYLPPLSKNRRAQFSLPVFSAPVKLNVEILRDKFLAILNTLEEAEKKKKAEQNLPLKTLEPKISIDDKIFSIRQLLGNKIKLSFSRLLETASSRTEIIVSFLAVLELAKQKELFFEQEELFSEITINKINI
jgi:segregation and condensation protein A